MQANTLEREHARRLVGDLYAAPDQVFVVHYALQRLRQDQGELAPPVAAIAVRNVGTAQGCVFSIKAEADIAGIDLSGRVSTEAMLRLEYNLLFNYNDLLEQHRGARFVHWYMRDEKFGFTALEHRYRKVLADLNQALHGPRSVAVAAPFGFGGGPSPYPVRMPDDRKVDLARIIRALCGGEFVSLRDLAERNGLSRRELIDGQDEPEFFESGNHARLQWSTSAKTRLIADVLDLVRGGRLRIAPLGPAPADAGRIFINYRREDTEAASGRLHDRLSLAFGSESVFIDADDIPAGVNFVEHLKQQIDACDVFLAVIGRRWAGITDVEGRRRLFNADDLVRREITAALARGIPVIPVLVDGARMPDEDQLPTDLHALRWRNHVEVRNSQFQSDAERLAAKVRQTIAYARRQQRGRL